jgi:hypothetical protein
LQPAISLCVAMVRSFSPYRIPDGPQGLMASF